MTHLFLSIPIILALFVVLGRRIGAAWFPNESRGIGMALGALLTLACFSITGSIVYYATSVNAVSLGVAAMVTVGGIVMGTRDLPRPLLRKEGGSQSPSRSTVAMSLIVGISLGAWWQAILSMPITDAVRSPWLVLSPVAIIAPAIAMLASFILLHRGAKLLGSLALFATLFSLFASASVLFPLGYGFDPFLHRATIAHIAEHGTITPKPFYYIGEYALELFGNILGGIPVAAIDAWLVPLVAALTLTITARRLPIGIAILFIGLGNFITTTPQSLAYLFTMLAIVTVPKSIVHYRHLIAPLIFALAALITHPIAGVPACIFVALSTTHLLDASRKKIALRCSLIIGATLALPTMFGLQAVMSHAPITFSFLNLWKLHELPLSGFLFSQGNTWLDALYLFISNAALLIIVLAGIGWWLNRKKPYDKRPDPFMMTFALIGSFIIVSLGMQFSYLISYERQDFALRLLFLATLFALPHADDAFSRIAETFAHRSRVHATTLGVLLFIVNSATIYSLYPRHDGYARSAAFNVSQSDIDTVYAIHNRETDGADYIVLSNQATASAALQEFGFRKYYHNDIFYYPIPTGGALYQSYLSMVDVAPLKSTMQSAMELAGVSKSYFVVSAYWWKSSTIIEQTKQQTDEWFAVDGGKTTIFVFTNATNAQ